MSSIVEHAKKIVEDNHLADKVQTLLTIVNDIPSFTCSFYDFTLISSKRTVSVILMEPFF